MEILWGRLLEEVFQGPVMHKPRDVSFAAALFWKSAVAPMSHGTSSNEEVSIAGGVKHHLGFGHVDQASPREPASGRVGSRVGCRIQVLVLGRCLGGVALNHSVIRCNSTQHPPKMRTRIRHPSREPPRPEAGSLGNASSIGPNPR